MGTSITLMMPRLRGSPRSGRRLRALAACLALGVRRRRVADGLRLFNKNDDYVPEDPPDKLYNEGLFLLNSKQDYKEAAKKFDEVDREDPYSEWARKALLMSAYAYYQAEEYDDCVNSAKRYVTLHPASPDAAYAQYLIGASYYDQILDVSRDQTRATKAIDALARGGAQISDQRICRAPPRKKSPWRATSSPARKWTSAAFT